MNIFVLFILGYILYRFIGGFLIPLFRTTSQVRQQFRDMNGKANGQTGNPPNASKGSAEATGTADATKSGSSKVGEYIDFEEVK
ncbi:MAG TPA: hypothetical protein VII44_05125 [Puia sp.]